MLVTAATGQWRANPTGTAVYFLGVRSARKTLTVTLAAVGLAAVLVLAVTSTAAALALVVVLGLLLWSLAPLAEAGWASRGARKQLKRSRPAGRTVVVHSVASVQPGEGRKLLEELNGEADRRGWTLALDAANQSLADKVYAPLGYRPTGEPVQMPWGQRLVPMARYPQADRGGNRG
jgi:hypothetical protein